MPRPLAVPTVTYRAVKNNPKVQKLVEGANAVMRAMGYTEHGQRHVGVVAGVTRYLLETTGATPRDIELGMIAAHLHDVGNVISRLNHPMNGGAIAFTLLNEMGMDPSEIAPVLGAIGNHEELTGGPVSAMSAALIIADKSDVHFSRVQNLNIDTFDIHDRVNHAVRKSRVEARPTEKIIELALEIDTKEASVMDYFQIFLSRMVMCRASAELLGYNFALNINGTYLD